MPNLLSKGIAASLTGNEWTYLVQGGVDKRIEPSLLHQLLTSTVSPAWFGLIADGSSHPLSERYGAGAPGLVAAQAVYPFATAVTQEIDYCAWRAAANEAFGPPGSEHGSNSHLNKSLVAPRGISRFGSDTLLLTNLTGALIKGAGNRATIIRGGVCPIATDGCWYTVFSDFSVELQSDSATVAFDLDGNVAGPGTTRGVQAVTLWNMLIDGGGSDYALAICRQGGSAAQGSECEFYVHLSNASVACYFQNGFNALANKFFGNIQNYPRTGIKVSGGTISGSIQFQSTKGYRQLENDGWDIDIGDAGAGEGCDFSDCRTESLRFIKNWGAVRVHLDTCVGRTAVPGWFASTPYGAAASLYKAIVEGERLFVATTEGTSGGSKPNFAAVATGGTVADNTIVWTETLFNAVEIVSNGSVDLATCSFSVGSIIAPAVPRPRTGINTNDIRLTIYDETVVVDASAAPRTVYLPALTGTQGGKRFTIKKGDTSANTVTIDASPAPVEGGGTTLVIPGGSRGSRTIEWLDVANGGPTQWLITGTV